MSPRKAKVMRSLRVDENVWEQATAIADARDELLSEEIRKFLVAYVRKHRKELTDE